MNTHSSGTSVLIHLCDTSVQSDIDLPMIAVIGNQSAGKSSLIESISGVTLPRSSGTCTRYATALCLKQLSIRVRRPQVSDRM